jgi:uncharacterized protein YbcI
VSDQTASAAGGRLNQQITNAIVRRRKRFLGRGPTKAQAFYRDNIVVVLMEDSLTDGERRLAEDGGSEAVLGMRLRYEKMMRPEFVDAVEELTASRVEAFLSSNHMSPDLAADLFVLDRPVVARAEPPRA